MPELVAAGHPIPIAGEVVDFDAKEFVKPRKALKVMSRETQLGFAAAEMAWAARPARRRRRRPRPARRHLRLEHVLPRAARARPPAATPATPAAAGSTSPAGATSGLREVLPLWLLKYLPNMAPAHVSIAHDARGPSNSIVAGETSGLLAIIEAADVVARGHADVMLAGGVSSTIAMMDLMWHAGARLSRRVDEPAAGVPAVRRRSRRLGRRRGRGDLRARNARARRGPRRQAARAHRAATAAATSRRPIATAPRAQAIRQAIDAALAMAGATPADVGHVSAHGMSTELDDRIEAEAIRAHARRRARDGAQELLRQHRRRRRRGRARRQRCSACERGLVPPTLNYETPDPKCPVNVVTEPTPVANADRRCAISHRTTGQAVALLVEAD